MPLEPRKDAAPGSKTLVPGLLLTAALTAPFARRLRRRFARAGIASPDQVFGLAWSGAMTTPRLRGLIENLPEGLTEIYLHPGDRSSPMAGSAPVISLPRGTRRFAGFRRHCQGHSRNRRDIPGSGGFCDFPVQ